MILSHFGSRFDSLIVEECLIKMGHKPATLTQGLGVMQLTVTEWGITFLDSYKYFPQPLASLPKRFQLEEYKGFFSHKANRVEHWNVLRKSPFPLSDYISGRDLAKEKEAKQKWWNEKNLEPYFDFNHEAVLYCKMDVFILMASCVKFLKQTFGFGQQMIERFGPSPAWNERRCHPIFHPFARTIPTLGSYS